MVRSMPTNLTSSHNLTPEIGDREKHLHQRTFFEVHHLCWFLPLCMAQSPSMTSLQQTLKLSLHIRIFPLSSSTSLSIYLSFYYTSLSSSASIQPPASLPFSFHLYKIIFYHMSPLSPSIYSSVTPSLTLHLSVPVYLTIKFVSSHI